MSFTLADLKTQISEYLDRNDLDGFAETYITLAQARMYRGRYLREIERWVPPPLRIPEMLQWTTVTFTDGVGELPEAALEAERLVGLDYLAQDQFFRSNAYAEQGTPTCWTAQGRRLFIAPSATTTYEVCYYAPLAAMVADTDADWVLTNAPHAYLHGALTEAFEFEGNDARAAKHMSEFAGAVAALNEGHKILSNAGARLVQRRTHGVA